LRNRILIATLAFMDTLYTRGGARFKVDLERSIRQKPNGEPGANDTIAGSCQFHLFSIDCAVPGHIVLG
jgi:hypothetical protein